MPTPSSGPGPMRSRRSVSCDPLCGADDAWRLRSVRPRTESGSLCLRGGDSLRRLSIALDAATGVRKPSHNRTLQVSSTRAAFAVLDAAGIRIGFPIFAQTIPCGGASANRLRSARSADIGLTTGQKWRPRYRRAALSRTMPMGRCRERARRPPTAR